VHSLVLTDIASGWTECVALLVREQTLIVQGFAKVRSDLPFAMRGLDTDNASRVHERDGAGLLPRAGPGAHPLAGLQEERPGVGGAEERGARSGGWWAMGA
jgi:hypothetical protein